MRELLKEAGIEVTPGNKRDVDKVIHEIVGVKYKNCPLAWGGIKNRMLRDGREVFIKELRKAVKS
jgi:predicted Fe-Mo cluster-binding NifX family protein